ncbi:hypothetical protein AVEN_209949-1 [Araneus ventricosus]|uniref:Uncharacterized protein n=1 Tax=Araneus ventricosus TaxID=182803 RepID=A0A4Y2DCT5_ARAVE|nr:hypothetical protein AVEN_209949-1 [Araneus ventricosus]
MHTLTKFKSPPRDSLDGRPVAALYKMAAMQEKSFCVLEYAKCSSATSVQRAFLRKYRKAAPGHFQYAPETWKKSQSRLVYASSTAPSSLPFSAAWFSDVTRDGSAIYRYSAAAGGPQHYSNSYAALSNRSDQTVDQWKIFNFHPKQMF